MIQTRVRELEELVRRHRELYYNEQPEISDEEFDTLVDELERLAPDSPVLEEVGASPAPETTGLPTKEHRIPMGSLDKVVEGRLDQWCEKVGSPFVVQEKYDGISLEIEYERGAMGDAITRGDGFKGEVVTHNAVHFMNVSKKLPGGFTGSLRGEVICRLSVFEKHFEGFANPRNTVSGTVRKKHGDRSRAKHFEMRYFDVVGEGLEFGTEKEKITFMQKELGLEIGEVFFDQDAEGIREIFLDYAGDPENGVPGRRLELDYEIDGLVVRADSIARQKELGELRNRPRWAMAYKFVSQGRETTLNAIDWSVGITGRVTPVARLEPIEVTGVTVSNAGLHNLDFIRALDLHLGDRVIVERKGDVIPQVVKVVKKGRGKVPEPPSHCSECDAKLELGRKYLICPNEDCPKKSYGDIARWIAENDIDSIGEKWIAILIENELIEDPADLYGLTVEDLVPLERMGKTLAEKMVRNIAAATNPPLDVFIAGLNVPEFSRQRAQMLIDGSYDTLETMLAATPEEIADVKGFADTLAERVHEGLHAREERIQRLLDAGVTIAPPVLRPAEDEGATGPLAGKSFCFTGAVKAENPEKGKRWTRKELQELVRARGGKAESDVKKGLDYLVMADPNSTSSKAKKARKLGTAVLSEEEFLQMAEDGA